MVSHCAEYYSRAARARLVNLNISIALPAAHHLRVAEKSTNPKAGLNFDATTLNPRAPSVCITRRDQTRNLRPSTGRLVIFVITSLQTTATINLSDILRY